MMSSLLEFCGIFPGNQGGPSGAHNCCQRQLLLERLLPDEFLHYHGSGKRIMQLSMAAEFVCEKGYEHYFSGGTDNHMYA